MQSSAPRLQAQCPDRQVKGYAVNSPILRTGRAARSLILNLLVCTAVIAAFSAPAPAPAATPSAPAVTAPPLKIGIIGTGRIGSALARHWAKAGHELMLSSRHPETLQPLATELGPKVRVGTPQQAAAFAEVIFIAVPYGAMPQIGSDNAKELAGKVIIDASNPSERRDGAMGAESVRKGAGIASRLVSDAGFDPAVIGSLVHSRVFDLGEPLSNRDWTVAEFMSHLPKQGPARRAPHLQRLSYEAKRFRIWSAMPFASSCSPKKTVPRPSLSSIEVSCSLCVRNTISMSGFSARAACAI